MPAENKTEEPIFSWARQDLIKEGRLVAPGERNAGRKQLYQQRRTRAQFDQSKIARSGNEEMALREHVRRPIGERFHLAVDRLTSVMISESCKYFSYDDRIDEEA